MRSRAAVAVLTMVVGCSGSDMPGSSLGTYAVTGTTTQNACGPGVNAPEPWAFNVMLSRQGETVFWSWLDHRPMLSSKIDGARLSLSGNTADVVGPSVGDQGPCSLAREDRVDVTFDAATPPGAFSGTVSYEFTPVPGTPCDGLLASRGGALAAMPCKVTYTVEGARQ